MSSQYSLHVEFSNVETLIFSKEKNKCRGNQPWCIPHGVVDRSSNAKQTNVWSTNVGAYVCVSDYRRDKISH